MSGNSNYKCFKSCKHFITVSLSVTNTNAYNKVKIAVVATKMMIKTEVRKDGTA